VTAIPDFKEGNMHKVMIMLAVAFLVLPQVLLAGDAAPITTVRYHSYGPQKLDKLPPVPVPPGNPMSPALVTLGKQVYFDPRLSKDNTVSCATCHDPAMGWSDKGPTSVGINGQHGGRRSPPVSNAAYLPLQFWDGRAATLEDQATGPIANPVEMGNTHAGMIRTLNDVPGYVEEFKAVFGTTPITLDQVAKAIAAFERTVVTTDSPFDRYAMGEATALSCQEKRGLEIFNGKGHCTACHWGANFTDGRFHNVGVAPAAGANPDDGRYAVTKDPRDKGAFKTPTIRDVGLRAPYMHTGGELSLESVVEFYDKGGGTGDANLDPLLVPLGLTAQEKAAVVAFLKRAMTSTNPEVAEVKPVPASEFPK
jgi:cytochrome c peroxidase